MRKSSLVEPITDPFDDSGNAQEMSSERLVQIDTVLRIIEDSIEKIKVSLLLPRIFENPLALRQYLVGTEYEDCLVQLQKYLKQKKKESGEPQLDYHLIKLIDLFHENSKIIELLPNWLDDLSNDDKSLLESLQLLYEITSQHMRKSAISELNKEKRLHQIYHENESVKKNIEAFQEKLRNQRINIRWKVAAKDGIIQKYEEDLAFKKWDNNVFIKQEIAKSSIRIRGIHAASVARQKEYEEQYEKIKALYEKELHSNIIQEKDTRDDKNKLLLQLVSLIKKYDQNIGEKIKENIYMQKIYDEHKEEFENFLLEFKREEVEYETIIRQRELEEKRMHEQRLVLFMMNRAARVIQRYWREYRRLKKLKAKSKGKKGKKDKDKDKDKERVSEERT